MQVHESQIIGELGKGYKYAIEVLNIGRIGIGAQVYSCDYTMYKINNSNIPSPSFSRKLEI